MSELLQTHRGILQLLESHIPNSVLILFDRDGRSVFLGGDAWELFQFQERKVGHHLLQLLPEKVVELIEGYLPRVLNGESFVLKWNGSAIPKEISLKPILQDLKGRNVCGGILMVTQSVKQSEMNVSHQSQKMESIGRLAGGIAHDFNNILTAIQGYADLAMDEVVHSVQKEHLMQISIAANRAASLTRQLLTFSRQQKMQRKLIDLNRVIAELGMMVIRLLKEGVSFKIDCDPEIPTIEADKGMIEQILLNLVVNASDSMPNGGELYLRTLFKKSDSLPNSSQKALFPEGAVCIEVQDTGSGMDAQTVEHIFEPFFTTKEVGKGTGLGLSTVYAIVEQHRGTIEVESVVGKGTLFRIYFPPAKSGKESADDLISTSDSFRGKNELILVVEDERPVRDMIVSVLNRQGYRTIHASTAAEAFVAFAHQKKYISLVLTDIMMPGGVNGCEMAEKIRLHDPSMKVVFCSGYSPKIVSQNVSLEIGVNFIQKPFSPNDLTRIIRKSLDS